MEGVQCKRVFGSDNRWGGEEEGGALYKEMLLKHCDVTYTDHSPRKGGYHCFRTNGVHVVQ